LSIKNKSPEKGLKSLYFQFVKQINQFGFWWSGSIEFTMLPFGSIRINLGNCKMLYCLINSELNLSANNWIPNCFVFTRLLHFFDL
jgi:hypothetical protein